MTVAEQNRTSLALLLVRTDKAVYGLTFGLGHLMIDQARIDPGFGVEFAVRCLDEDRITKVRRQVMDARGRTDENSAISGEHIRGFGIEQFGEIVSQISGQIAGVPLTFTQDRDRPAHVTGSDRSIKLHLGTTRPSPLPEFEFIAQVRPLNQKSEQTLRGGAGEVPRETPHRPFHRPVLQVADGRLLRDAEGRGTADLNVAVRLRQGLPPARGALQGMGARLEIVSISRTS